MYHPFEYLHLNLQTYSCFFFTLAKTRWLDSDLFWDFNFNMLTSGEISTEVIENQRHFMNYQYFLVVKSILVVYVSGVSRQKTHPCHSFPPNESIFRHPSGEGQVWQVRVQKRHNHDTGNSGMEPSLQYWNVFLKAKRPNTQGWAPKDLCSISCFFTFLWQRSSISSPVLL